MWRARPRPRACTTAIEAPRIALLLIISAVPTWTYPGCYSVAMHRILVSGASGLIGSALVRSLESHGYKLARLIRRDTKELKDVHWDPMRKIPPQIVSGFDAVIHLSGENIAGKRGRYKENSLVRFHRFNWNPGFECNCS